MVNLLEKDNFLITRSYNGGYIKFFIKIFFVKLSFKIKDKKLHTNGQNNNIYIKDNGILKKAIKKIPDLKIDIDGKNNTLIIGSSCKFTQSVIVCNGNNNSIIIENSNYSFSKLFINLCSEFNERKIHIKENVSIGGARLHCWGDNSRIIIGENSMLSTGINIMSGDGHIIFDKLTNKYLHNNDNGFCEIGNHVWIGMENIICKNTKISDNCIIGAGSVVTKSFDEENCIIAGNPAKIIKRNINWDISGKI